MLAARSRARRTVLCRLLTCTGGVLSQVNSAAPASPCYGCRCSSSSQRRSARLCLSCSAAANTPPPPPPPHPPTPESIPALSGSTAAQNQNGFGLHRGSPFFLALVQSETRSFLLRRPQTWNVKAARARIHELPSYMRDMSRKYIILLRARATLLGYREKKMPPGKVYLSHVTYRIHKRLWVWGIRIGGGGYSQLTLSESWPKLA